MARNILITVDVDKAEAEKGLESLGKALQAQTEHVHDLRSGVDDAVEQLNIFGDAGAALVGEINKISDPMKRLAVANQLAASKSGILNSASQKVADSMQALRVKLIVAAGGVEKYEQSVEALKGGLGLAVGAVGGFAAAIGGAATAAVTKFIEEDAKAHKSVKALTDAFDDLVFTFGNAIVGGDNFVTVTDRIAKAVEDMTRRIDDNRGAIFEFTKSAISALTYVAEWVAKAVVGVYGFVKGVIALVQEATRQAMLGFVNMAEFVSEVLGVELGDQHYQLKMTLEGDDVFKDLYQISDLLDGITSTMEGARNMLSGEGPLSQPVESAERRRRVRSGGAGAKPADEITFSEEEDYRLRMEAFEEFFTLGAGRKALNETDQQTSAIIERMNKAKAAYINNVNAVNVEIESANRLAENTKRANEASAASWETHGSAVMGFAATMTQASAQIAASMSGQGGAWTAWQQAGLQAIAAIADQYANMLLGMAAANLFMSPALAAAQFAGALALKAVSGTASGSASRLGSRPGGAGSTTTSRDTARVQTPQERTPEVINLYMDANRVGQGLRGPLQRMARNGQLLIPATTR